MNANDRRQPSDRQVIGHAGATLAALGLSTEQLSSLSRQGFVAAEYRGSNGPFFKLRFRMQGQQIVKYLGSDELVAAQIRREVLALQAERRLSKELNQLTEQAWQVLRQTKRQLQHSLEAAGFAFHGLAIRKKSNLRNRNSRGVSEVC